MLKNFQMIFENSPIGSALLRPTGEFVEVNKALTNILGYSESNFLKMDLQSITHIDGLSEENQYIQQMLEGVVKTHQIETRLKGKNGDLIWVLLTLTLARKEDSSPLFFILQIKDITRRINSERSLREMHERYDLAVRAASVGLWDWNVLTNELFWSDRFKEIVGIKDNDFIPHLSAFEDRLHPDDHDRIMKALIDHANLRKPYNVEYKLRHQDGHYVWIHARGQAVWNEKGEPIRMAGSVDDITEKKNTEAKKQKLMHDIERSNELITAIMSSSQHLIIATDIEGLVVYFNNAAERYLQYNVEEIVGKCTPALWHNPAEIVSRAHELTKELGRNIEPGFEVFIAKPVLFGAETREWEFIKRDKTFFPGNLTATAIKNKEGNITGYLGVIEDITSKKQIEQELLNQYDLLKQSNQDLDDFAYIASHDLKEPLRGLSNNATFLKEDYKALLDEGAITRIDRMIYLAERMEKLVNDLLHFAKLNKQEIDIKEVDLNNVIKDILSMTEIIFEKQNVKIIIPRKLPKIRCSEVKIAEVFRNLIVNALKYNKSVSTQFRNVPFFYTPSNLEMSPFDIPISALTFI